MNQVLLLDNARPQTSLRKGEAIAAVSRLFSNFLQSHNLAPSDSHISGSLQDVRRRNRLADDDEPKHIVRQVWHAASQAKV
jgi:hypothetical protein